MAERDHYSDRADGARAGQMLEPSERFVGELQFERRHVSTANRDRDAAPYDHIMITAITVVICMIRIALPLDSSMPKIFWRQK